MDVRLEAAMNALAAEYELASLTRDAKTISENYRLRTGAGKRLLTREGEAAAYAVSRMPATHAAAQTALSWALASRAPSSVSRAWACCRAVSASAYIASCIIDHRFRITSSALTLLRLMRFGFCISNRIRNIFKE